MILGPKESLIQTIDKSLQEKQVKFNDARTTERNLTFPLRPSSAGHCSRKLALEYEEYKGIRYHNRPIIDSNIIRLFALGHKVESAVISDLIASGSYKIKYRQQVVTAFTLKNGEMIEGSIDLVLYSDDHKIIADVKSKKDKYSIAYKSSWDELMDKFAGFKSLKPIGDDGFYADNLPAFLEELGDDFLADNIYQLNLYANTSFVKERGINIASLIYYNKNDSRMFELRFKPSEEVFEIVRQKFEYVVDCVENMQVDEMECDFQIGTLRHSTCDCHKYRPYLPEDPSKYYFNSLPPKKWPTDSNRFKRMRDLEDAYSDYLKSESAELDKEDAEQRIISILTAEKKNKVKFADGKIYEAKWLKTYNKFVLRRSKL